MTRFLLLLSMLGLAACAFFHVAGWTSPDAQDAYPYFWVPAITLFAIWIPAVKFQDRVRRDPADKRAGIDTVTAHAPQWMKALTKGLFVYGFVMFVAFGVLRGCDGSPTKGPNGTYTVRRNKVPTTVSEAAYHQMRNREVLIISAWTAMFYGAAMTLFASIAADERNAASSR